MMVLKYIIYSGIVGVFGSLGARRRRAQRNEGVGLLGHHFVEDGYATGIEISTDDTHSWTSH